MHVLLLSRLFPPFFASIHRRMQLVPTSNTGRIRWLDTRLILFEKTSDASEHHDMQTRELVTFNSLLIFSFFLFFRKSKVVSRYKHARTYRLNTNNIYLMRMLMIKQDNVHGLTTNIRGHNSINFFHNSIDSVLQLALLSPHSHFLSFHAPIYDQTPSLHSHLV